jgi:SSS family solute:Na+ symporter
LVLAALLASLIASTLSVMNSVSTLAIRDMVVHFRPKTSERAQVSLGRLAIVVAALLGIASAYLVYKTPDGLYKYLQTISIYLVMPLAPSIFFGICSKRITVKGAVASVAIGVALSALFVTDQLIGVEGGARLFPWLHREFTLNYTYRGLWSTILVTATLFAVSSFTRPKDPESLKGLTVDWGGKAERLGGLTDWRIQLGILSIATVLLYWWLW